MKRKFLFYLCSLMLVLALGIGFVTKAPVYANVNAQTYEEITEDTSGDDTTGEEPTDDTTGDGSGDEVVEGEVELALYWAEDSSTEPRFVAPEAGNYYEFEYNMTDVFELRVYSQIESTDRVQFYYYKDGNYKYIEIPNEDNSRSIDISTILKSVGTFKFFAKINNNLIGENNIYTINIINSPESSLVVGISYEEIIGEAGTMNSYRLILSNTGSTTSGFNLDDLTILWYIVEGDSAYLVRSGNYATYTPEAEGRFTIRADVLSNGVSILGTSRMPEVEILARSNNSANVLMYVLIVVGVLSVGLVISIVIKVKSEKVW